MKVLHVLDAFRAQAGGVVQAVIDLCDNLAASGVRIECATLDATDAPCEWQYGARTGPKLRVLRRASGLRGKLGLASSPALEQLLAPDNDVDVMHLHTPWATLNTQAAAIARKRSAPYVLTVHGMLDDWSMSVRTIKKRGYLTLVGNRLLAGASAVHCTADAELEQARKWFPPDRGFVAPLLFDIADYRSLPTPDAARAAFPQALEGDYPRVLFLSRLHPKKGVEVLLRAFPDVLRRERDAQLLIAGPGEPRYVAQLEQLARDLGIANCTHFLGMVQGDIKRSLYRSADTLAIPTSQENFGLVFIESLVCCTPVITTRGVDIWRELEATGAARIVEQAPEVFARAILDALANRDAARAQGERGRDAVLRWLDPVRIVSEYKTMYAAAVKHGSQLA